MYTRLTSPPLGDVVPVDPNFISVYKLVLARKVTCFVNQLPWVLGKNFRSKRSIVKLRSRLYADTN